MATPPSNTIIIGAGIIGVSTAHYLSHSPRTPSQTIHLIDSSPTLFASASGNAGGFLAADWFASAVAPLGALSFRLHAELAAELGGREKWGWCRSTGTSLSGGASDAGADDKSGEGLDWLNQGSSRATARERASKHEYYGDEEGPAWLVRREGESVQVLSEGSSTAQVDPRRLCHVLLEQARGCGVQLHQPARAISVSKDIRGELASVRIAREGGEEVDLPCTRLLIAAGAWTPHVFSTLFPSSTTKLPITSLAGHSLVVRTPRWATEHEEKGCHAVFGGDSNGFSPEIFSRIGGEIYIAGLNDASLKLPESASESKPDPEIVKNLMQTAKKMLGAPEMEDDLQVVREGLCFRPITKRGPPIVCRVPDQMLGEMSTRGGGDGGVFVAAGHGPWGISQSLGTGKVMAELIDGQAPSVDIKGLSI